jgi:hypothetical protein
MQSRKRGGAEADAEKIEQILRGFSPGLRASAIAFGLEDWIDEKSGVVTRAR